MRDPFEGSSRHVMVKPVQQVQSTLTPQPPGPSCSGTPAARKGGKRPSSAKPVAEGAGERETPAKAPRAAPKEKAVSDKKKPGRPKLDPVVGARAEVEAFQKVVVDASSPCFR
eukprot:3165904-Pyramimonas_sp.AAC.1